MASAQQPTIRPLGATGDAASGSDTNVKDLAELVRGEGGPIPPERLSEEAFVRLRLQELQYDHALALTGLRGTLYGAFGAFLTIIFIVGAPAFTKAVVIGHWELVVLVATIVVCVTFYGAFIFKQALSGTAMSAPGGPLVKLSTGLPVGRRNQ